jgi:hypothetical protein
LGIRVMCRLDWRNTLNESAVVDGMLAMAIKLGTFSTGAGWPSKTR